LIAGNSNLPAVAGDAQSFPDSIPFAEDEEAGAGFTLLQIWHMLLAHVWISVGIFVLVVGLAFLVIKNLPKSYFAQAALIVNSDTSDPLAGRNQGIGQAYSFFPTQVELINNSVVLEPVTERLNLKSDPLFTGGFKGDPKALKEIVVNNLRSTLNVQPGTGSQLLYISATARSPDQAAEIANAVAEEYLHQTKLRTNAPAMERATRYTDQMAELKSKVEEAQAKVVHFRERHGMADLGTGGDLEGAALADLQGKLLLAQNARRQLEGSNADAQAALLGQESAEAATLRNRLSSLEGELMKARSTMGPRHPKVLQVQAEIEDTRRAMQSSVSQRLSDARKLESRLQAEVNAERNRLLDRRELQDEGAKLVLEKKLAEDAYSQALRGLDQIQFASQGNYQDVTLVSRAVPPVRASKPNKLKLFAAALAAGFFLALGGPFAYELLLNRRIRCRDDLERGFRIVTLAQFGPIVPAPQG
jgi:uncharacterized protein involved in exopolysaccharide biosynthesis